MRSEGNILRAWEVSDTSNILIVQDAIHLKKRIRFNIN